MEHSTEIFYSIILILLLVLSAFFSCSETALMAINRYRLKHKARLKKRYAVLILKLLKRPDRLLGTILIGNTVANIFASALTTILAISILGEKSVVIATVFLTFIILILSEIAPKTLAALYPERIARVVALPISMLLKIFYPFVWFVNAIANSLLRLLGFKTVDLKAEPLSRDELRTLVYDATGKMPSKYQRMLLSILDLNKVTVDDVMIPHHQIVGIDLTKEWQENKKQLLHDTFAALPVYRENINNIVGVLWTSEFYKRAMIDGFTEATLVQVVREPYFIPEGTLLNIQLQNFQQKRISNALVVDEYGEIKGFISLKDILEEIVGEFTTNINAATKLVQAQPDGSFFADGAVTIRELNRIMQAKFPLRGPRTLNGLIVEYLETIPVVGICVRIANYPIEIVAVHENRVKTARIFPRLVSSDKHDEEA